MTSGIEAVEVGIEAEVRFVSGILAGRSLGRVRRWRTNIFIRNCAD